MMKFLFALLVSLSIVSAGTLSVTTDTNMVLVGISTNLFESNKVLMAKSLTNYVSQAQLSATNLWQLTQMTNYGNIISNWITINDGVITTNHGLLIGGYNTNYTLLIGQNGTNYVLQIGNNASNYVLNVGAALTNHANTIGANATNYANTVAANASNAAMANIQSSNYITPYILNSSSQNASNAAIGWASNNMPSIKFDANFMTNIGGKIELISSLNLTNARVHGNLTASSAILGRLSLSNQLMVIDGGTGLTNLPVDRVLLGNGTNPVTTAQFIASLMVTNSTNVSLVGDSVTPGNFKYYGTDSGGSKGYWGLPIGGGTPLYTNAILAAGASNLNFIGFPTTNVGGYLHIGIPTATYDYTALSNNIKSDIALSNFVNQSQLGQTNILLLTYITNYVNTVSNNVVLTNGILATNFTLLTGLNGSNFTRLVIGQASNSVLLAITNNSLYTSNGAVLYASNLSIANNSYADTVAGNASNSAKAYALILGGNTTNYIFNMGTNATNYANSMAGIASNSAVSYARSATNALSSIAWSNATLFASTGSVIRASNYLSATKMPSNSVLKTWSVTPSYKVVPTLIGIYYDASGYSLPLQGYDLPPGTLCYYSNYNSPVEYLQTPNLTASGWFQIPGGGVEAVEAQGGPDTQNGSAIMVYALAPGSYVYTNLNNLGVNMTNYANSTTNALGSIAWSNATLFASTGSVIRASNYLSATKMPSNATLLAWSATPTNKVFPHVATQYGFDTAGFSYQVPWPTYGAGMLVHVHLAAGENLYTPYYSTTDEWIILGDGSIEGEGLVVIQGPQDSPCYSTVTVYPFMTGGQVYTNYLSKALFDVRTNDWLHTNGGYVGGAVELGNTSAGYHISYPQTTNASWYGAGVVFKNYKSDAADLRNWSISLDGYTYGDLHFKQGATLGADPTVSRMVISKDGNVGIGTNVAQAMLHVTGDSLLNSLSPALRLQPTSYGANYGSYLTSFTNAIGTLLLGNDSDNYIVGGSTGAGGKLNFMINNTAQYPNFPNGTIAMTILANGRIGINTINPAVTLDVRGKVAINNATYGNVAYADLQLAGDISLGIAPATSTTRRIGIQNGDANWNIADLRFVTDSTNHVTAKLSSFQAGVGSHTMTLNQLGNLSAPGDIEAVGTVGAASSTYLTANGISLYNGNAIYAPAGPQFNYYDGSVVKCGLRLVGFGGTDSGFVGIATNSPTERLEVAGTVKSYGLTVNESLFMHGSNMVVSNAMLGFAGDFGSFKLPNNSGHSQPASYNTDLNYEFDGYTRLYYGPGQIVDITLADGYYYWQKGSSTHTMEGVSLGGPAQMTDSGYFTVSSSDIRFTGVGGMPADDAIYAATAEVPASYGGDNLVAGQSFDNMGVYNLVTPAGYYYLSQGGEDTGFYGSFGSFTGSGYVTSDGSDIQVTGTINGSVGSSIYAATEAVPASYDTGVNYGPFETSYPTGDPYGLDFTGIPAGYHYWLKGTYDESISGSFGVLMSSGYFTSDGGTVTATGLSGAMLDGAIYDATAESFIHGTMWITNSATSVFGSAVSVQVATGVTNGIAHLVTEEDLNEKLGITQDITLPGGGVLHITNGIIKAFTPP